VPIRWWVERPRKHCLYHAGTINRRPKPVKLQLHALRSVGKAGGQRVS
jgi:hypothetical protein